MLKTKKASPQYFLCELCIILLENLAKPSFFLFTYRLGTVYDSCPSFVMYVEIYKVTIFVEIKHLFR